MHVLPLLILRLFEKKRPLPAFSLDLFLGAIFSLFSQISYPFSAFFWTPVFIYRLAGWYSVHRFQMSLSLKEIFGFCLHPRSFFDSLRAMKFGKTLFKGALLLVFSISGLRHPLSPDLLFSVSALLFIFSLNPQKKSPEKGPQKFDFPTETYKLLSPAYPALRKTFSFLGEKEIEIPILKSEKPHIIFLFLESFRAKNVGCLGAKIGASPHFDQWAKKGHLFKNFHANGLQTFRAFISAFFGIPPHLRTLSLKPFCSMPMRGLPQILKEHGYSPSIIQSGDFSFDHLHTFFKSHGFDAIFGCENIPVKNCRSNSWGVDDKEMVRFSVDWLEKQKKPTFLSLFTIANHHPWKKPPDWNFPVDEKLPSPYQKFLQTFSYTDECLGLFLNLMKEKGLLEKSILFIAADHGQELGERGFFSEMNHTLFEENLHLPLLILSEGRGGGKVYEKPASFIDFLPTVLDMLNIQDVHHSLGKSLLRNSSSPVYFSLQMQKNEIGILEGRKKVFGSHEEILGFDLDADPEEKKNIGLKPLFEKAESYFGIIETLYKEKRWAPDVIQKPPSSINVPENADDDEWLSFVHAQPNSPIVSISPSSRLTDRALLRIDPIRAAEWVQLSIANCPLLTDRTLEWIAKKCPNLIFLNASQCPLASDVGVFSLLNQCHRLRYLWLEGLDDLTDFTPKNKTFALEAFSLKDAPRVLGEALFYLYRNSPHLLDWSASLEKTTNIDLKKMSEEKKICQRMTLFQGRSILDDSLNSLLSSQLHLQFISLEDFPKIEFLDFSKNEELTELKISDCSSLNDAFFETIEKLPLKRLILQDCPKITEKGIESLLKKNNCEIAISNCQNLNRNTLQEMKFKGLNLY